MLLHFVATCVSTLVINTSFALLGLLYTSSSRFNSFASSAFESLFGFFIFFTHSHSTHFLIELKILPFSFLLYAIFFLNLFLHQIVNIYPGIEFFWVTAPLHQSFTFSSVSSNHFLNTVNVLNSLLHLLFIKRT